MGPRRAPGDGEVERVRAVLEARFGLGGLEPTEKLGEYVVLDRLGAGATGVVHRAYHKASDRTVAIMSAATRSTASGRSICRLRCIG